MWWHRTLTDTERLARQLGFLNDQKGILRRYLITNGAWDEHLARTKHFIVRHVERSHPQSVAVLGSGWLLDVPLHELAASCREVHLFDLVHPARVKKAAAKYPNVHFHTLDLSGGWLEAAAEAVCNRQRVDLSFIHANIGRVLQLPVAADMCISVNLLSQLDELLTDYLYDHKALMPDVEMMLRTLVQQAHIQLLRNYAAVLVSDVTEHYTSRSGRPKGTRNLLHVGLRMPPNEVWHWNFDPRGTYREGLRTSMEVGAWYFAPED